MKMIIGGAYQGKLDYAKRTYGVYEGWADGRTCTQEELASCAGIHHFHELVRRMEKGEYPVVLHCEDLTALEQEAEAFAGHLLQKNPHILIVSDEIGCGVVPLDPADRRWREAVGRVCTSLASRADEVVRIVCGVGMRIK